MTTKILINRKASPVGPVAVNRAISQAKKGYLGVDPASITNVSPMTWPAAPATGPEAAARARGQARAGMLGVQPNTITAAPVNTGPTKTGARSTGGRVAVPDTMTRLVNRMIASMLTPAQQQKQTQDWINASIKASQAGINSAYAQDARTLQQQEERAHQYAMALGSLRDMSGAQTTADYTNAAHDIQGLGTGLTGTIADSQQATANDAAQRIAAATGGLGVTKGLDVEGMKNIAQYTGVTMPSTDIFEQAASHAAQARLAQDVRGQEVENIATGYRSKIGEAAKTKADKLAELAASRPSLYQTALQNATSGTRSDMATVLSALALQNTTAKTPSEIAKNTAEAGATTKKGTAAVTNAATGQAKVKGVLSDGSLAGGFYWAGPGSTAPTKIPSGHHIYEGDATGHILVPDQPYYWGGPGLTKPTLIPKNYMLDPNDPTHHKIVENPNAFAPKTPTVETPAAKSKRIQGLVQTWTTNIGKMQSMYAHDVADPYEVKNGYAKPDWRPKMSYAAAFADIVSKLPPDIKKSPQMKAVIDSFLSVNGYTIPSTTTKTTTVKKGGGKTKKTTTTTKGGAITNVGKNAAAAITNAITGGKKK